MFFIYFRPRAGPSTSAVAAASKRTGAKSAGYDGNTRPQRTAAESVPITSTPAKPTDVVYKAHQKRSKDHSLTFNSSDEDFEISKPTPSNSGRLSQKKKKKRTSSPVLLFSSDDNLDVSKPSPTNSFPGNVSAITCPSSEVSQHSQQPSEIQFMEYEVSYADSQASQDTVANKAHQTDREAEFETNDGFPNTIPDTISQTSQDTVPGESYLAERGIDNS